VKQLMFVVGAAVSSMLAVTAPAHADTSPWSQGVPEATQDQANALFEAGNAPRSRCGITR